MSYSPIVGLVLLAALVAILFGFAFVVGVGPKQEAQTWDQWWTDHTMRCSQCHESRANPNVSMCPEAFEKFLEFLRKQVKPEPPVAPDEPIIEKPVTEVPGEPEAEPLPAPAPKYRPQPKQEQRRRGLFWRWR